MPFDWSHPEFRLRSPRDWDKLAEDANHIQLLCRETGTSLTMSIVAHGVAQVEQEAAGRLLMEERRAAHLAAVTRNPPGGIAPLLHYDYERLQPHPSGNGFEVVYEGTHENHSVFGFVGYVTTRKMFSLFVETAISFTPGHRSMFREVVGGLQVTLP